MSAYFTTHTHTHIFSLHLAKLHYHTKGGNTTCLEWELSGALESKQKPTKQENPHPWALLTFSSPPPGGRAVTSRVFTELSTLHRGCSVEGQGAGRKMIYCCECLGCRPTPPLTSPTSGEQTGGKTLGKMYLIRWRNRKILASLISVLRWLKGAA